jgi:hypothetical protein
MAFKNRNAQRRIVKKPCEVCGTTHVPRHAAHIVDETEGHGGPSDWNALSLCPNCHTIFDELLRPKLHRALTEHGVVGLPRSWQQSNKASFGATDDAAIDENTDEPGET